jgi:hypothetical protein
MRTKLWLESLKGREQSENLGVDGKIIFKRIFGKACAVVWIGFIWLITGKVAGSCEHGNEPSGSIKDGNILTS